MKLKSIALLSLLLTNLSLFAQNESQAFFEKPNELGINTTRILSNLLALVDKDPSVPYALFYARHTNKFTFRLSAGVQTNNTIEFDNTAIVGQTLRKEISDRFYNTRVSIERRYNVVPKLAVSLGLDLSADLEQSTTQTENFFFRKKDNLAVGAGPSFKVMFKLNKRIYFTTETNLIAKYGFVTDEFKLGLDPAQINKSNPSSIKLNMPTTLFIGFNF